MSVMSSARAIGCCGERKSAPRRSNSHYASAMLRRAQICAAAFSPPMAAGGEVLAVISAVFGGVS